MPATESDLQAVSALIYDATRFLEWCASSDSFLTEEEGVTPSAQTVMPEDLAGAYIAALDQAQVEAFDLALSTLQGENLGFPRSAVLAALELAGWTGALRDFKLQVLDHAGRSEVMTNASEGRAGGGGIRRRVFRAFVGALNAALDSLSGIPGVSVIKELKDFVDGAQPG